MEIDPKIYAECLAIEQARYDQRLALAMNREERTRSGMTILGFLAGLGIGVGGVLLVGNLLDRKEKRNSD